MLGKRILILLCIALVVSLSGCADAFERTAFHSVVELKAAAGERYLYPEELPEGFAHASIGIVGDQYTRTDTWQYSIDWRNTPIMESTYRLEPIAYELLEPGAPQISRITILSFEPEHRDDRRGNPNRDIEMQKFNRWWKEAGVDAWRIGRAAVLSDVVFREMEADGFHAYDVLLIDASFMDRGVLYTARMELAANPGDGEDALTAAGKAAFEALIFGMLSSNPEQGGSTPNPSKITTLQEDGRTGMTGELNEKNSDNDIGAYPADQYVGLLYCDPGAAGKTV